MKSRLTFKLALTMAISLVLSAVIASRPAAQTVRPSFAYIEKVPSLLVTHIQSPSDSTLIVRNKATCFLLEFRMDSLTIRKFIVSNLHPFELYENNALVAETDTGLIYINARDTVVTLRVKVRAVNRALDLALLELREKLPPQLDTIRYAVLYSTNPGTPKLFNQIAYAGFPLEIGIDIHQKQNYPLSSIGYVAQVIPGESKFVFQAAIFEGASGSPIFSIDTGELVGIVCARKSIPRSKERQESFGVAIRADRVAHWINGIKPSKR